VSTTVEIVKVLKAELKLARLTYADLARQLGLAESSVKRMFAKADMPLKRIDQICRVLGCDFAELARKVANAELLRHELTEGQERAVVADKKLLLMAICALSQWSFEQIVSTYRLTDAEAVGYLVQLDRLGLIDLRPLNRYRLRLAKTFRWRPDGPVMQLFRSEGVGDYLAGSFDGEGETFSLVHGQISLPMARLFLERLQRVSEDFARQHLADQRLPDDDRHRFTLVIGMRSWLFGPLRELLRNPAHAVQREGLGG